MKTMQHQRTNEEHHSDKLMAPGPSTVTQMVLRLYCECTVTVLRVYSVCTVTVLRLHCDYTVDVL